MIIRRSPIGGMRPKALNRRNQASRCYFLTEQGSYGDYYKIGNSVDPHLRLAALNTGNPRRLILVGHIPGGPAKEAALHQLLAKWRVDPGSEWFHGDFYVRLIIETEMEYATTKTLGSTQKIRKKLQYIREQIRPRKTIIKQMEEDGLLCATQLRPKKRTVYA